MGPETSHVHKITYGPLIDMALYVMCLMGPKPLEGWGHESLDFFMAQTARAKLQLLQGPKKSGLPWPTLPMALVMDLSPSNTLP